MHILSIRFTWKKCFQRIHYLSVFLLKYITEANFGIIFSGCHHKMEQDRKSKIVYIVKPDEGSQGDGIYLITDPKDYMFNNKNYIVQEYIARPFLLERLKFDFR